MERVTEGAAIEIAGGIDDEKLRVDVVFFVLTITLLGLANFLNPEKPAVSRLEKRALEKRPEYSAQALFSGAYFKKLGDYYSDTFIFRDNIVKVSREIKQAFSLLGPGVSIITDYEKLPDPPEKEEEPSSEKPTETGEPPDNELEPPEVDDGDDLNVGYWLVVDGQAVQLFKFDKENFDYYADILNQYRAKLGQGVKLYSLIAPSNSEFVQLRNYQGITDSQNEALYYLNSRLDPGIRSINAYDALNSHTGEYIYFRTDHHWSALGAYYGYCAFMEARGEKPVPLEKYQKIDLEGFLGSSYSKTLDPSLEENPDTISVYMPFTKHDFTVYYGTEAEKERSSIWITRRARQTNIWFSSARGRHLGRDQNRGEEREAAPGSEGLLWKCAGPLCAAALRGDLCRGFALLQHRRNGKEHHRVHRGSPHQRSAVY